MGLKVRDFEFGVSGLSGGQGFVVQAVYAMAYGLGSVKWVFTLSLDSTLFSDLVSHVKPSVQSSGLSFWL